MTQYLRYPTEKDALAAAAADWEYVLGRPKRPQDVTTYLWGVIINPNDNTALGVVYDDLSAKLPNARKLTLLPATDPIVSATLSAISVLRPVVLP